jgi:uncharacterized repeat protein (TIGR04052 family)
MSLLSLRAVSALILLPALPLITCCTGTRETPVEIHFGIAAGATARNLQFYIHDVQLLDEQGNPQTVTISAEAPSQSADVALIDLAGDPGAQRNSTLLGTTESGASTKYSGIRFTVGVPFALNHANPLTAAPPLDRGELFWTWQSGYKFLRADFVTDGKESSFHLGSTGCSAPSALRPPAAQCAQPNRMRVELRGDPLKGVIRFQLSTLVANNAACTGNYAHDVACTASYASTALQPETGVCAGGYCTQQRLWTLE